MTTKPDDLQVCVPQVVCLQVRHDLGYDNVFLSPYAARRIASWLGQPGALEHLLALLSQAAAGVEALSPASGEAFNAWLAAQQKRHAFRPVVAQLQ